MKFSVVTSVLNGAEFLNGTIASVRQQTWRDHEHIIIDAGSTDDSIDIIKAAAANDPRLRFYSRPGEPLYQSIVWGLSEATGDVLSWLNADDLLTPWAMAAVARSLRADAAMQWVTGLPACWDRDGVLRYVRPDVVRPQILIRNGWFHRNLLGFIQQESIFFTKSLFQSLSDEDKKAVAGASFAGDYILWKRFARRTRLRPIPTVLGGFRRHDGNMSVQHADRYMEEVAADGAVVLPPVVDRLAQSAHRCISAVASMRLAMREDQRTLTVNASDIQRR